MTIKRLLKMSKIIPENIFTEEPKFIFIHIPKTAGCSIQKWLHSSRLPQINTSINWDGNTIANKHRTAIEYKKMRNDYDSFFKFAFVRNPYDRIVSFYNYAKYYCKNNETFEKYIFRLKNTNGWALKSQSEYINNEKGNQIIDFVGKFENLYDDLNIISKHINIKLPKTMFHENASKHKHYREIYTEETKSVIDTAFAIDIKKFDYKF